MKKYPLMLIIAATVALVVIGVAQYFIVRQGIEKEVLAKAERDMMESKRVAEIKAQVESAIRNILPNAQRAVSKPDKYALLTARLVANNPNIVGAGVAFPANFYKSKGKEGLYAPYSFDDRPAEALLSKNKGTPNVHSTILTFDYTDREWYQKVMNKDATLWTQPYLDNGGTHILMCTYAVPVKVKDKTVAVFFADVPLKDVSILSENLHSGVTESSWISLCLQLASLFLLCFIIWKSIYTSRKYKEQVLDPEKEQLEDQVLKLKEINSRLTKRNQELAEKNMQLQRRIDAGPQESNQHFFG